MRPETIGWRVAISGMIDSTLRRAARNDPSTPKGSAPRGTWTGGRVIWLCGMGTSARLGLI